jgi:putative tryptophan/tyrosine transport system substrate-binding protein
MAARGAGTAREQMRRIGVLMSAASETDQQAGVAVFKETLHQLDWIDGRNMRIEIRWAHGDPAEARKDAEELLALPADVIMTAGQLGLQALLQVTRSVPIVFDGVIDPVGGGQIDSLARPGGNATGFITFDYALAAKWAELLKQIAPTVTRVAVIRDSATAAGTRRTATRRVSRALPWLRSDHRRRAWRDRTPARCRRGRFWSLWRRSAPERCRAD